MSYKPLFILIEGADDERFFERIVKPKFEETYSWVKLWKYAKEKPQKRYNFLTSIEAMNGDYLYVADINDAPCVTSKKEAIQNKIKNCKIERMLIVKREIESWYLAGLDDTSSKNFKIKTSGDTEGISKERFDDLKPKIFDSRIDFMLEILKSFSPETAKRKNGSFKYFVDKYDL